MFALSAELDVGDWTTGLDRLREGVDDALEGALRSTAESVAAAVRAEHPYNDYTYRLTRSTRAYAPRGRFSRGDLRVEVVAAMPYATYVQRRRGDWLMDAFQQQEYRLEHDVETALGRAVDRSGLR